jgi:hypothetical protein
MRPCSFNFEVFRVIFEWAPVLNPQVILIQGPEKVAGFECNRFPVTQN